VKRKEGGAETGQRHVLVTPAEETSGAHILETGKKKGE